MSGGTGYVPGVFDLFHIGHLNVLRRASLRCDRLIAGVVSDAATYAVKGRYPVVPQQERLDIVSSLRMVDLAVLEETADKVATWEVLRFDVVFKGDDWKGTAKGDALEATFAARGVRVDYLPYTLSTSTTRLRGLTADQGPGRTP